MFSLFFVNMPLDVGTGKLYSDISHGALVFMPVHCFSNLGGLTCSQKNHFSIRIQF